MKILVFTEGTILMHKNAAGHSREEIINQVRDKEPSVEEYTTYIPIGNAVEKLKSWKSQGARIGYLTSRKDEREINDIREALNRLGFPEGELFSRQGEETYKDVTERILPDVLIEDDCESIGGTEEMTTTHVAQDIREKIKSLVVKEFGGIDYLPESINRF